MARGIGVMVGLAHVDPTAYDGSDLGCNTCEADARALVELAQAQQFAAPPLSPSARLIPEPVLRQLLFSRRQIYRPLLTRLAQEITHPAPAKDTIIFIAACRPGEIASGGSGAHALFTQALLNVWNGGAYR